jgi:hypothetical protein
MQETTLGQLKKRLTAGKVYRRAELEPHSSNIDRHLSALVQEGVLTKLQNGLYFRPKESTFGKVPPEDGALLRTFLKSSEFLVYSPNSFNSLGLGTTQLYNLPVVLNPKRHGELTLGGRNFLFERRRFVPKQMTKEVLLVELLNHSKWVAEDRSRLMDALSRKLPEFDTASLKKAARDYGTYSVQKTLKRLLSHLTHVS